MSGTAASKRRSMQTIPFPNGNEAFVAVEARERGDDADALLRLVGLGDEPARPVIVVCGSADLLKGAELSVTESVLGPAVARACRTTGAAVVDGGTAAGVMAVVGEAIDDERSPTSVLVGVAPRGRVRLSDGDAADRALLEPHHSHFILADSDEWGGERSLLFSVAERIAKPSRVVVVLAGGGPRAREETLEAVRRGWPVVVLRGSGGLADELADRARQARWSPRRALRRLRRSVRNRRDAHQGAPGAITRRILRDGDLRFFAERDPTGLARCLVWELQDEPLLKDAWRYFAGYDRAASVLRRGFERFQRLVIGLGILGTTVALLFDVSGEPVFRWAAIATPAVLAVTVAVATRRAAGKRWVLLRAAAESVKSEIYRYRTRTGFYAPIETSAEVPPPPEVFSTRLKAIDAQLVQTEASSGPMDPDANRVPPDLPGRRDDGLTTLDGGRYVELRVDDQLAYYRGKVKSLNRLRGRLQALSIAIGGSGTVLAAAGAEVWIALTTVVSAGAVSYLSALQVDNTIVVYNQSATHLAGVRRDWFATRDEDESLLALERMVTAAELALTAELSGWVQQMNNAIEASEASLAAQQARVHSSDTTAGAAKA